MASITEAEIALCYRMGVLFAKGTLDYEDAITQACESGMNRASAGDYIRNVKYMNDGFAYKRTISALATEYYLSEFANDFGPDGLARALAALSAHIEYYEGLQNVTLHSQRAIRDAYAKIALNGQAGDSDANDLTHQIHQAEFQKAVQTAQTMGSNERQSRLKRASVVAKPIRVSTTVFRRNPDVVAERLHQSAGKCEGCKQPAPFLRANGTPFLEVHHIIPLAENGMDTVDNTMALCPNCHREAHFGTNKQRFAR